MAEGTTTPAADTSTASSHQQALPEQVRRQIAEAENIRADMERGSQAASVAGGEQPAEQASRGHDGAAPPPPALPAEDDQSWEQRYRSLQGRFESSQRSNQQMADRLSQLENTISAMQVRGAEPPPSEPPPPAPRQALVTDQERNDYGEELLGVMGKRAREEIAPEFEELSRRLKRLESGQEAVGEVIGRTQKQTVFQALTEQVPDWKEINTHPAFKDWLSHPDPFSGRRREDMLLEAFNRHEAPRVVTFFKGFLSEATGQPTNPSSSGSSAPPLANGQNGQGNGSGKPSLEDFAAPGRARSAPQELPPEKPIYTTAWIAEFMAAKRTGKYKGREADAEAIERDIYQAQHEGRIR